MTRDDFAALAKPVVEPVEIPETGQKAYVKRMTGADRLTFILSVTEDEGFNMAQQLVRTICDESGVRLFTDSPEDLKIVADMDCRVALRLNSSSLKLNLLNGDTVEEAKKN